MGFLAVAFAIVGMTGLIASYVAPLPLQRALARDAALDELLATGGDPAAAIQALRPRLAESADALLAAGGDLSARVAHERTAMHARLLAEAGATGSALRWLISIVTVMAAAFGIALLGVRADPDQSRRKMPGETSKIRET
jgi:hypothetical protein